MNTYKEILNKIVNDYIKNPNSNTQDLLAKRFMDWTWLSYKDIYEDMEVDENNADHYDILVSHFIPTMTDWEVELTIETILEEWIDNVL